jgi:hypothetical protein
MLSDESIDLMPRADTIDCSARPNAQRARDMVSQH